MVEQMDVRSGGIWRFIQRGPDDNEYAFHGEYREVVPPERLVYTLEFDFAFEGRPRHVVVETLTFAEHDGKTTLTATWLFESVEDRDGMLESGAEEGMTESWDRLAELLERRQERTGKRTPVG